MQSKAESEVLMKKAGAMSPWKTRSRRGFGGHASNTESDVKMLSDAGLVPVVPVARCIALLGIPVSSRNQGVQALGASLVNLCAGSSTGVGIRLLIGNSRTMVTSYRAGGRDFAVPVVNYRLSPRSAPRDHLAWIVLMSLVYSLLPLPLPRRIISRATPWIEALEHSDFAGDIRGGDSFSDIYGMKRFVTGFLVAWTVLLVKGSMVQFPQTYGPFKSPMARWMARYLLLHSSVIVARDKASQRAAQGLVGSSREVLLSPDVAFSLEVSRPEHLELDPPLSGPVPPGVVGINVNGLMYRGGYTRDNMFGLKMDYPDFLRSLLIALLNEQPQDIWLVPHTYAIAGHVESDPEASHQLRNSLPRELRERVRIIAAEYDQHEIKGVIGMCDFFIGSRMHSCIAALSQGIPCVGVAYSVKFKGVFESVGMESWVVDGRDVDDDEAVSRIIRLYRNREGIREPLLKGAAVARERLAGVFQEMMEKLGFQTRKVC